MKILFVCKHNRFRSKVAEAIFEKLNKNKKIKVESAGLIIDELRPYIAENVLKIMREKEYVVKGKPRQLKARDVNNYDLIVIVANNIEKEFFESSGFKGKLIKWEIPDADEEEYDKIKRIIKEIEEKVKGLVRELNN